METNLGPFPETRRPPETAEGGREVTAGTHAIGRGGRTGTAVEVAARAECFGGVGGRGA